MQEPSTQQFPFSTSASVPVSQSGHCHFSGIGRGDLNCPAPAQIFVCCHMQTDWGLFSFSPLLPLHWGAPIFVGLAFFLFLMPIPSFSLTFWSQSPWSVSFLFSIHSFSEICWNSTAEIVSPCCSDHMNFCFLEVLPHVWCCRDSFIFFCVTSLPAPDLLFFPSGPPTIPVSPSATTHSPLCTSTALWKTQAGPQTMFWFWILEKDQGNCVELWCVWAWRKTLRNRQLLP